jgi:DNA helicase-2/ATP-dependent DNA helicase PcrA
MGKTIELFQKFPLILKEYCTFYGYILVDEFQDLSISQFEILKMMFGKNQRISVVGDEDQSIYAFRGGTPTLFNEFRGLTKNVTEVTLKMNYRSTVTIVRASSNVIKQNSKKFTEKTITAAKKHEMNESKIRLFPFVQIPQEIDFVCNQVEKLRYSGVPLNEIAILCRVRKNTLGDFVKELKKRSIACQVDKPAKINV